MRRRPQLKNIVLALLSGPLLATIVLLIPLGILTGLSVVLDPSLAMYEFVPEEELLVPFFLLAVLISAANVRLAVIMARDRRAGRIIRVTTDVYADDPSGADNIHGHPGRAFAEAFRAFLQSKEGKVVSLGETSGEDYGWGFWIGEDHFSPIWVAIGHSGRSDQNPSAEEYMIAITLEPPIMPWRRLTYKPDFGSSKRSRDATERVPRDQQHAVQGRSRGLGRSGTEIGDRAEILACSDAGRRDNARAA